MLKGGESLHGRHAKEALCSSSASALPLTIGRVPLPRWRGALQNAFHQLSQCNVSGALRPKSATSPPAEPGLVESGTLVINGRRVTVQRRRNAFAISVGK
jgi:hypothetical protein